MKAPLANRLALPLLVFFGWLGSSCASAPPGPKPVPEDIGLVRARRPLEAPPGESKRREDDPWGPPFVPLVQSLPGQGNGAYLSAFALPVAWIEADEDSDEFEDGIEFDADLDHGSGAGIALGGYREGPGVGLLYLTSEHREANTRDFARFHGGFLEATYTMRRPKRFGEWTLSIGLGGGVAGVDFDDSFEDELGLAWEARASSGISLGRNVSFEVGGGYLAWGHPGETVGEGAFLTVGLSAYF